MFTTRLSGWPLVRQILRHGYGTGEEAMSSRTRESFALQRRTGESVEGRDAS